VSHSWSDFEGLKTPKNGEPRRVPLLPEIRGLLLELLAENPYINTNPFVFFSDRADRPCSGDVFRRGLVLAIKATRDTPPDWSKEPFDGDGYLWMIRGKNNTNGELQGEWSEPEEVTGLYKTLELTGGEKAIIENLYCRAEIKPEKPKGINITGRKIDVHSFRHYYARSMADRVAADKVARVTGHKNKAMAELYQNHVSEEIIVELGAEAEEVFGNILQFNKGA
jgi:integrase